MMSFKFLPCLHLLPWQRILGQKWLTRPPWKIIACCLHLPPLFSDPCYLMMLLKFLPCWPCCHGNRKIDYNSASVKANCSLFASTPYFWARAIQRCHLNFSPANPRCHGNKFWDKIDYNLAPTKDDCTLFWPSPYFRAQAVQWCHVNFFFEDPCCHGNQPFLFKDKIGCRLTSCLLYTSPSPRD